MDMLNLTVAVFQDCVAINETASWNCLVNADLLQMDGGAWKYYGGGSYRVSRCAPRGTVGVTSHLRGEPCSWKGCAALQAPT